MLLDLFSRKIIAYGISSKNSTYLIISTFKRAFKERGNPQKLTLHSDQDAQYISKALRKLLRINKVVQSFSKLGSPYDNVVAEAFFASIKKEELYRIIYKSERQFCESVDNCTRFYNTERPHSTLNYKIPDKFELLYEEKKVNAI
ncbi:MAG TPA: hypothetical protein DCM73_08030 [Clostridiales bacterium]|nr:hypothetical protein [Clostridiales bacterium]